MSLESTTPSSLLELDSTYATRLPLRTHFLRAHRPETLACNPAATPAVAELYTWLTRTYLPARFPSVFEPRASGLWNAATGDVMPFEAVGAEGALEVLGRNVDTDFLVLLPEATEGAGGESGKGQKNGQRQEKYVLQAFVTAFPAGFRTRAKLGLRLADIHGPVPGYAEKLEKSMDRFFASLVVGRVVKRWNWTVGFGREEDALFCTGGLHGDARLGAGGVEGSDGGGGGQGVERGEVDLKTAHLRCERQTLHRLPESKALVFAFKVSFSYFCLGVW